MDKIFKIGLLVLGFSCLAYLFCPVTNQVGRYQYHEEPDTTKIFDTSTGLVYRSDDSYASYGHVVDVISWAKYNQEKLVEKLRKEETENKEAN